MNKEEIFNESDFIGAEYLVNVRKASKPFYFKGEVVGLPFNIRDCIRFLGKEWIPAQAGIYHLFLDDILVYVGISQNIRGRILMHIKEGKKDFDNVLWFCAGLQPSGEEITYTTCIKAEKGTIKMHSPAYNLQYLTAK